ncbi:MAG TPA: radical SAM family heme chaperone HemW [Acidimicrobiia bacterium]|nr:radical SAM family heme chaperone HemW [Acidimicrobiia bacterium]
MALGVYVHIPFCASKCDYCDFATWTDRSALIDDYVDACETDVRNRVRDGTLDAATSVFVGGGTPSLLPAGTLARILDEIPTVADAEVTVECNPESIDAAKLARYRAAGVNRCSFGVQSFRPHVLAALGRRHDVPAVTRAVDAARDHGFETFNLDLIYGAVGESPDDWRATLDATLALDPPHVSAYALTIEPATTLGQRVAAGSVPAPDDDDQAAKYERTDDVLTAAGLDWYEISNWSRPGHECRHHLLYWDQGDYVPIGCAAHGHQSGHRTWNVRTPERYIERIRAGVTPETGGERLDAATRAEEAFALALRTRGGAVPPPGTGAEVDDLIAAGLLTRARPAPTPAPVGGRGSGQAGGRVTLTRRGRLLASAVTVRLLAAAPTPPRIPIGTR